ncbi:MAG TPA: AMP-binding protein [Candidatus Saccharimonadales bacterium]|jgi:long-chain acyl-CoA synthetase|nr:AMP-binding protein [Candidatus Saccharimonadales bacterium]
MIYVHSLGRAWRFYGDRTALSPGGIRLTFQELHERVEGIAVALSNQGFRAGDRLALLLPNGPEFIELVYACSLMGVIAIPLNTRLSTAEIDHVLTDASPHGMVRHSLLPSPTVQLPWQRLLDQEPWQAQNDSYPNACYDPEAVLALIYTSGTTGRPKGVKVTHANILANVDHFNYWMGYKEGGVYLHAAPIFHIADFPAMFAAPAFGAKQVTIPKFSPQGFCELVERERVTHTVLVPTMLNLLTQMPEGKSYDLSSLQVLAYGGSPMAPELVHRVRKLLPNVKLLQCYGLSETGFLTGLEDKDHVESKLLSCGRPCPGIDLRVEDETGKEVEVGQHGELVARGANVMHGYWNDQQDTTLAFRNGMFRTGDIGYQDSNGYFYILDRLKDMIVTGGENVYSGEVEAVIYKHSAVREVAVFGVPDRQWGELVMATIVVKPEMVLSANDLTSHCKQFLANYKIPRRIEFSDTELPKSGSGKILKRVLRERFWAQEKRAVG